MKLKMIGCNHHTADVAIREQLAFSPEQTETVLKTWLQNHQEYEAVLLSTCNRTELYIASENGSIPDDDDVFDVLTREKNDPTNDFRPFLVVLEDSDVVQHLFTVTGSLDSMVLGESQVLAQVKSAYKQADEIGVTGPITHAMFQAALGTAKRIDMETQIHKRRISIPSVAVVDFALQIFERLDDKKTLVFGAGEMAEETLHYLTGHGATSITILNRSKHRAEELAAKWNGKVADWDRRWELLIEADVVLSVTGASEPVVRLEEFRQRIEPKRKGRSLFILDLGVPRDFEPAIGDLPDVYLYSLDDLKAVCEKNRDSRAGEISKALKIVAQGTERFFQERQHHEAGSIIRKLREDWAITKEMELERLFHKLPELEARQKDEIRYAFDRLVNKLLHPPLESLRDESRHGVPQMLIDALSRLFRLKN